MEFHRLHSLNEENHFKRVLTTLENLNSTHLPVNIHANNWSPYDLVNNIPIPNVIEVTYLRKDLIGNPITISRQKNSELNAPNNPNRPEINLGVFT